jgi:hypothetical protein
MSKAIQGAAMIGVGVTIAALGFFVLTPASLGITIAMMNEIIAAGAGLAVTGASSLIASALTTNRGMNITTRMAAGFRQIIYGTQRVGGTTIYQSTTGAGGSGGTYVYNFVIVLATHEIDCVQNVYLDGRQVFFRSDGYIGNVGAGKVSSPPATTVTLSGGAVSAITATGGSGFANVAPARYRVRIYGGGGAGAVAYATGGPGAWVVHVTAGGSGYTSPPTAEIQGAYTFGGHSRSDDPDPTSGGYHLGYGIGPGGQHYNFDGKVYAEVRFGDQIPGDVIQELATNDPLWLSRPSASPGTPYVGGCAYLYLNVGRDAAMFPTYPEIRITVNGKNRIFDPRSGKSTFTTNWALCVADVLTDVQFGVGDPNVNQAQLIAAANVCDEQVSTSQGNESRYTLNLHYDTSASPGDALGMMMPCAAGRLSYIAGEWYIWPAYWQGPSFTFDQSALIEALVWNPYRSFRELINRVTGTYTAPNFPYSTAGNLYDHNGWYYGTKDNIWAFAFQPTNFPQYAVDPLHGFASDVYLTEDGGVQLPQEITLRGVLSIVQAQRVAKIILMRNRMQGSGTFRMGLAAWAMQEADVMQFTFAQMSWANKYLEVTRVDFVAEPAGGESGAVALTTSITVQETAPDVYEWSAAEELTPYDIAANPGAISANPAAPTNLTLEDDTATALMLANGLSVPRLLIQWTPPDDVYVNIGGHIQVQYADASGALLSGAWIDAGMFDGASTSCYLTGLEAITSLNVRVRALRGNLAASDWVEVTNFNWGHPPYGPLTGTWIFVGTTPNAPISTTGMANLPELGNLSVPFTGLPVMMALTMQFAARGTGGAVTNIGTSFGTAKGSGPPTVNISISGNGSGASASVSFAPGIPAGANTIWTPTLSLVGGSNYTVATATVNIVAGSSDYTSGNSTYPCTVSGGTPSSGVPVSVQVLMDGAVILGPSMVSTDASGASQLSPMELLAPPPTAATHVFSVQASTTSATPIVSTSRTLSLINLS